MTNLENNIQCSISVSHCFTQKKKLKLDWDESQEIAHTMKNTRTSKTTVNN